MSVGELVRQAIDKEYVGPTQYVGPTREEKLRAWEEIKAMRVPGEAPSPEELNRIVEDGIDERFRRVGIDVPRRV